MSRIGKAPIELPSGVEVKIDGQLVTVKGPKGTLTHTVNSEISVTLDGNVVNVTRSTDLRNHRALHGLNRTLINNMVEGVSKGFTKNLELIGVGYRAQVQGKKIQLQIGMSHPVEILLPEGMTAAVEANTKLSLSSANKQELGDIASLIRSKRPPEPYKGKGIRYAGEHVRRKAGKAGK